MKFERLYSEAKEAFRKSQTALWCSESTNDSQKAYSDQIKSMMDELFAPKDAMPLVQCMSTYKAIPKEKREEAINLVSGLWTKDYNPYVHQYESWKALSEFTEDKKTKSIVVTSGTGSGKTECFMMPLIADLNGKVTRGDIQNHEINALFLYPLNALMEDQKERLNKYLQNTGLSFAVYNGNTPDSDNEDNVEGHELIESERKKYNKIVATRTEIRTKKHRPNILLTNPTMLEYMLLREKDQCLFTQGSLKWIVIDETHTFTGAGAAELALLIRRVLIAFGVDPKTVRFATSSATIGNGDGDAKESERKLKEFIAGISGQDLDQIVVINGQRSDSDNPLEDAEAEKCKKMLYDKEYARLDEVVRPEESLSIEERLSILDDYCDHGLKAKVHFFNKVLNSGLRVKLSEVREDGSFQIYSTVPLGKTKDPYLELVRCGNCGEYIAVGDYDQENDTFKASAQEDRDIFDNPEDVTNKVIFGLTKDEPKSKTDDGNTIVSIDGDSAEETEFVRGRWNIIRNIQCKCPHCSSALNRSSSDSEDDRVTTSDIIDHKSIKSFRVSSDKISRLISPVILDSVEIAKKPKDSKMTNEEWNEYFKTLPHQGQQFISFVDSRQLAARSTLKQNLEEEKLWVYSRVFHELCRRKANVQSVESLNRELEVALRDKNYVRVSELSDQIVKLNKNGEQVVSISWKEIHNLLMASDECDWFFGQYNSKDRNKSGDERRKAKGKYVYSVMIESLGRRPAKALSPENMGLFTSYYPLLDEITKVPSVVEEDFNSKIQDNIISLEDWKTLLHVFMDVNVRSNMSVFLTDTDNDYKDFDISNDFQRYESEKMPTRPLRVPQVIPNAGIIVKLVARLLGQDYSSVLSSHKELLEKLIAAIIEDLKTLKLIEKEKPSYPDHNVRLNLMNLSFKLYDSIALCDTSRFHSREEVLRPVETLFKGYSPYLKNNEVVKPVFGPEPVKSPYPYFYKDDGSWSRITKEELHNWAQEKLSIITNNKIWGENGVFSDKLDLIYLYPQIFVQAEHTAQVEKQVSKLSQDMFKEKKLNILACSTTMEMGIDLGDLEVVLLCSIPPHPANYKQRAGRSGRDLDCNRSVCITLCSSDSLGLRTLYNPLATMIERPTAMPFVDLKSRQVVQRHVNSFLLRESGLLFTNDGTNNLGEEVICFFTNLDFDNSILVHGKKDYTKVFQNDKLVDPTIVLGDESVTRYQIFVDWVSNYDIADEKYVKLLKNTNFDRSNVRDTVIEDIVRCKEWLKDILTDFSVEYTSVFNNIKEELRKKTPNITDLEVRKKIFDTANKASNYKHARILNYKYCEQLSATLISFLAKNRFTPNANMPVNIIEFDVNQKNASKGNWNNVSRSNPSYVLQEALSQYTPGNTIILSNEARVVRGILTTGIYTNQNTFKKIYSDDVDVKLDQSLPNAKVWYGINGKDYLELIQPYAFIPDINEPSNRRIEPNTMTFVDALLVNATAINDSSNDLIAFRTSDSQAGSKILYYNVGIGYGFCVCTKCWKAAIELEPGRPDVINAVPISMNNNVNDKDKKDVFRYHDNIQKEGVTCICNEKYVSNHPEAMRRNVIIGNTIETDFCELRLKKHDNMSLWLDRDNKGLLLTLGIAFKRTLVELLGIADRDIDFTILPIGSICIYDTNPGGSGYSKRLGERQILNLVIAESARLLAMITTKDQLLDKYTMRYFDDIDIDAARAWLIAENSLVNLPSTIKNVFPQAVPASFGDMLLAIKNASGDRVLFVNKNWNKWNYYDVVTQNGWSSRITSLRTSMNNVLYVTDYNNESIPFAVARMLSKVEGWTKAIKSIDNVCGKGIDLYPLAYIDGSLFFTQDVDSTSMSEDWGKGNIYCVKIDLTFGNESTIEVADLLNSANTIKFVIDDKCPKTTLSNQIASIVESKSSDLIAKFVTAVNSLPSGKQVTVTYQDEHLKSGMAIVAALQFISYFVDKLKRDFTVEFLLEKYVKTDIYRYNPKFNNELTEDDRNTILSSLLDEWKAEYDSKQYNCIDGLITVNNRKDLPHWRVLSISCGDKSLEIYPNGGIINEWFFDFDVNRQNRGKFLTLDNLSVKDKLPLYRDQVIMYDVVVNV